MDYLAKIKRKKEEDLKDLNEEGKKDLYQRREREISELCEKSPAADSAITIESAHSSAVYWDSDGRILGPARFSHVAKSGNQFYLCLEFEGSWRWIHESLLRSKQAFDRQGQPICNCCGGSEFWRSEHVAAICWRCHPPASPSLAKGEDHAD